MRLPLPLQVAAVPASTAFSMDCLTGALAARQKYLLRDLEFPDAEMSLKMTAQNDTSSEQEMRTGARAPNTKGRTLRFGG